MKDDERDDEMDDDMNRETDEEMDEGHIIDRIEVKIDFLGLGPGPDLMAGGDFAPYARSPAIGQIDVEIVVIAVGQEAQPEARAFVSVVRSQDTSREIALKRNVVSTVGKKDM